MQIANHWNFGTWDLGIWESWESLGILWDLGDFGNLGNLRNPANLENFGDWQKLRDRHSKGAARRQ